MTSSPPREAWTYSTIVSSWHLGRWSACFDRGSWETSYGGAVFCRSASAQEAFDVVDRARALQGIISSPVRPAL